MDKGTQHILGMQEELSSKLKPKWTKSTEEILEKVKDDQFYIFTFIKKDFTIQPATITMYHVVRRTKPDMVAGTILRWVDKKKGAIETVWALPNEEEFDLYKKDKMYENEEIHKDIKSYFDHINSKRTSATPTPKLQKEM